MVPRLYDYLRPFYPVKQYRMTPQRLGAGAYPQQLMRDIADILRHERPDLCSGLTPSRVRAEVERHLKQADRTRPMGEAMFMEGGRYRWTGREAVPVEPAITGPSLS